MSGPTLIAAKVWLAGAAIFLPLTYLLLHGQYSMALAIMVLVGLILMWLGNHTLSLSVLLVFLLLLGDERRIVVYLVGGGGLDPLVIVGAALSVYLSVPLLLRLKLTDTISKTVFAFMVLMILEIFNPKQGSFIVGVSGALFYLVPLLWFWVGRTYGTERMAYLLLFRVLLPLGVLDALVGYYQAIFGPLPWQVAWLAQFSQGYIYHGNHIRSFGFSTGALEYNTVLLASTIVVIAAVLAGRRAFGILLILFVPAMVIASSRGGIVRLLFAGSLVFAVMGRSSRAWIPRLILALAVGLGMTFYLASNAAGPTESVEEQTTAQMATAHVVEGLSDPAHSTATAHTGMITNGVVVGVMNPIGYGLGSTTLAAGKFGGNGFSSEFEISDCFISMGIAGGLIYLGTAFLVFRALFSYVRSAPRILGLTVVGVLSATFGLWFALGQYSFSFLLFFLIGIVTRPQIIPVVQSDSESYDAVNESEPVAA
jgi:hypothetical protein